MQNVSLIRKIQDLPPETVSEVEDFVDFLTEKRAGQPPVKRAQNIDLLTLGIEREEAAEQRSALASFSDDWELPEMEIYDEL
jgi:Protein of unknown function (DUF2281).